MKKLALLSFVVALFIAVRVDAGVLNSYEGFKGWVNGQNVKDGLWYDYKDSDWSNLVGTSLFDYEKWGQKFSLNAGYASSNKALGYATIDLAKLADKVISIYPKPLPFDVPLVDAEYSFGFGAGYDFNQGDLAVGNALVGVKLRF